MRKVGHFAGTVVYERGVDLNNVSLKNLVFLKGYFVRLKLVYYENISVVYMINTVVNQKCVPTAYAKKHLATIVDVD
jgi:hypothetical protein